MLKQYIIFFVIFIFCIGIGGFFFSQQGSDKKDSVGREPAVIKDEFGNQVNKPSPSTSDFTGTVLAGTSSPYVVFNQRDYDRVRQEEKIIFLEFYASWCPICRAQESKLIEGFTALTNDNVVGFRVNYNDPETDDVEKQLAKDFGVVYQHTHVILKDGKVVSKSNDQLDKESFVSLMQNVK